MVKLVIFLGSLVQLCCGEWGTLQTSISGACGKCSHFMDHTRLAPTHSSMCFLGLHCLGSRLLCKITVQSKLCIFVLFPGPSSSDDQVLGECTVPGGPCVLITSLVLATQFLRCATRAPSHVCCVSPLGSWFLAATLLADVNRPGS